MAESSLRRVSGGRHASTLSPSSILLSLRSTGVCRVPIVKGRVRGTGNLTNKGRIMSKTFTDLHSEQRTACSNQCHPHNHPKKVGTLSSWILNTGRVRHLAPADEARLPTRWAAPPPPGLHRCWPAAAVTKTNSPNVMLSAPGSSSTQLPP